MSVAQDSNTEIIYISLLDEGTPVVRPTRAARLSRETFLVLATPDYDADLEDWEFKPGTKVKCVLESHNGDNILVARSLA